MRRLGIPEQNCPSKAEAASEYIESRFHLKADRVGIMPLGDHPPPKTGRKEWNGLCLVLVEWKK